MPFQCAPMSNAERQRRFRARNPGYWRKYYARERASRIAAQKKAAALVAELARARWAEFEKQAAVQLMLLPKLPLMLPAPVQDPAMAAIDALAASLASRSDREPQPLATPRSPSAD